MPYVKYFYTGLSTANCKMRIAVVAHLKYPIVEPFAGGLEAHTSALMSGLEREGHEAVLFAAAGSVAKDLRAICAPTGASAPETANICEGDAYRRIMAVLRSERFDVVHFNALHFLPIEAAASISAPMVAVLHCPPFEPLEQAMNAAPRNVTLVSVSKRLISQWPKLPREPLVIDNGVDLDIFKDGSAPRSPVFAAWCGRIVPEKGLHLAIEAVREAGMTLRICGPIADVSYWKSEVAPRLGPDVVYLGHLSHEGVATLLAQACVFVCTPCWDEPFGLVVVEALACGTPVAGFARGALVDILDDSSGVLGAAGNVAELAKAIRAARVLNPRACRRRAEIFGANLMVARYLALYRTLTVAAKQTTCSDRLPDSADAE